MTTTTRPLALASALLAGLLLAALAGCKRPDLHADAGTEDELAGAWLRPTRDGQGVEGFDLRPDGRLELLNAPAQNGVAWNVAQGALVVSTTSEHSAAANVSRLEIVAHSPDALELRSHEADFFAGSYRRANAAHVAGVVTYLERSALPPDARVEVELALGERVLARARFPARQPVPLPFELAYLAGGAASDDALALRATISERDRALFVTPAPVPVPDGDAARALELVLRPAP